MTSKKFVTIQNEDKDQHLLTISETSHTQLTDHNNRNNTSNNNSISILTNSNDTTATNKTNQIHWNDSINTSVAISTFHHQPQDHKQYTNLTYNSSHGTNTNSILHTTSNTDHKHNKNNNDDTESVASHISFGSSTDGIDVLRGNMHVGPPNNFLDWTHLIAARIITSVLFKRTMLFCILVSTIALGIRTIDTIRNSAQLIHIIDFLLQSLLMLFTIEILLTLVCFNELVIKSTGWLISDIIIISIVWYTNDVTFLILRSFRLIRALRKASGVPALQWAVRAILHVLPRLIAVIFVLVPSMLAIFAILFTNLYQDADIYLSNTYTDDTNGQQLYMTASKSFHRLDVSALTLFQIMTGGRSWADVCTSLMSNNIYPMAWLPMVGFIIISMFFATTLIIALMCDAVSTIQRDKIWKSFDQPSNKNNKNINDYLQQCTKNHINSSHPQTNKISDVSVSPTAITDFIDSTESISNHPAQHYLKQQHHYHQLEQKMNELTNTVEILLRVQIGIQESIESLIVQQQQLLLQDHNSLSRRASSPLSSRQQLYQQQQQQSEQLQPQISLRNTTSVSSTSYTTATGLPHVTTVPSDEH